MTETAPRKRSTHTSIPFKRIFGAESIRVLKGLDAVRQAEGHVYRRHRDGSGLHSHVYEVRSPQPRSRGRWPGHATMVDGGPQPDIPSTCATDGRRIPLAIHKANGISRGSHETKLHAGEKFDQNSLQGVGRHARLGVFRRQ